MLINPNSREERNYGCGVPSDVTKIRLSFTHSANSSTVNILKPIVPAKDDWKIAGVNAGTFQPGILMLHEYSWALDFDKACWKRAATAKLYSVHTFCPPFYLFHFCFPRQKLPTFKWSFRKEILFLLKRSRCGKWSSLKGYKVIFRENAPII